MLSGQKTITIYHRRMKGYKGALSEEITEFKETGKTYVLLNANLSIASSMESVNAKQATLRGRIKENVNNISIGDKVVCQGKTYYLQSVVEVDHMTCEVIANG